MPDRNSSGVSVKVEIVAIDEPGLVAPSRPECEIITDAERQEVGASPLLDRSPEAPSSYATVAEQTRADHGQRRGTAAASAKSTQPER